MGNETGEFGRDAVLLEHFLHLRSEIGISSSNHKHTACPQPRFDPRAHLGKEGRIFDLHHAAGEHHIETPLRLAAREPLLKVVVIGYQMTEKALLVLDASVVVAEHLQRSPAGSDKSIPENVVHQPSCPPPQTADISVPPQPTVVQQRNLPSE